MTELLTNVHRHAQPDKMCTVEIELLLDRLTVSVHDHDPRLPAVDTMTDDDSLATCGRGLAMVAAVSESWGVRAEGDEGKVVWFALSATAPVGAGTSRPPRRAGEKSERVFAEVEHALDGHRTEHAPARSAVVG